MDRLSRNPNAFIRPSPSQSHLGGVARRTREAVAICEAAGFDVVLVETVGVGQSETIVSQISDLFLLLLAPAGGDELQGVKRGIMEIADMILVNKADGDLKTTAMRTCADYAGALRLLRSRPNDPDGFPMAMTVSAIEENGLSEAWDKINELITWRRAEGYFDRTRQSQVSFWFKEDVRQMLLSQLDGSAARERMDALERAIQLGQMSASLAADSFVTELKTKRFD
jgi:LAO/AO transport system kinase